MDRSVSVEFFLAADNYDAALDYVSFVNEAISLDSEKYGLFRVSVDSLFRSEATIGILRTLTNEIGSALNMVPYGDALERKVRVQGVRSAPKFRGMGFSTRLVREGLLFAQERLGALCLDLIVACDVTGLPFEVAHKAYLACGFDDSGIPVQCQVVGLESDAHLGKPGTPFLTQRMIADAKAIARARQAISEAGRWM